jgi:hypothetical protein
MTIAASGRIRVRTVALVTPAEIDEAAERQVNYRGRGR